MLHKFLDFFSIFLVYFLNLLFTWVRVEPCSPLYFRGNKVKMQLGIGKGKKLYDKREEIAKKDAERYMQRHQDD